MRYKKALGIKNIDGAGILVPTCLSAASHSAFSKPVAPIDPYLCVATVYAMGLYIDTEAAEREVGKEDDDNLPAMSPEHNEALAEREHAHSKLFLPYISSAEQGTQREGQCRAGVIANNEVEKSVRIVLTSGLVNQPRFSKTMRDSLEPRLRQVAAPWACIFISKCDERPLCPWSVVSDMWV